MGGACAACVRLRRCSKPWRKGVYILDVDFQRVWDRVAAKKQITDEEQLMAFWTDERRDAADYARLARRAGSGQVKRLLLKLSAEESEHAKRLRSMAFLMGNGDCPKSVPNEPAGCENILRALKRRFTAEEKGAEAYAAAAAETHDPRLRSMYTELAEDERKHGNALWSLLKNQL